MGIDLGRVDIAAILFAAASDIDLSICLYASLALVWRRLGNVNVI